MPGLSFGKHLGELFTNALTANHVNFRGPALDGSHGLGFDDVGEARGKSNGAQHAQLVFSKATIGITDGADDLRFEIGTTTHVVENAVVAQRVEKQSIDGEVAALYVF